jgi:leucyl/phenylalanyl-tRNA--protein transferase
MPRSPDYRCPVPVQLSERVWFPDPESADAEGLVAVGGDLSVPRLRAAYRQGIFPWTVNPITWWSPDPRAIFELDRFHVPRSLARFLRKNPFEITLDHAFPQVMQGCAEPAPGRRETWITPEFIGAYTRLHRQGHAHSLECWHAGQLVGGIYGVSIGGFFAGESMFHRVANASKVALHHLVRHLRERGFALFDIQQVTPVTRQLGAVEVPRSEYLRRLEAAVGMACRF